MAQAVFHPSSFCRGFGKMVKPHFVEFRVGSAQIQGEPVVQLGMRIVSGEDVSVFILPLDPASVLELAESLVTEVALIRRDLVAEKVATATALVERAVEERKKILQDFSDLFQA